MKQAKETVCVTGASGGLGQALLEQLAGRYHVKALFRAKNDISDDWARQGCTVVRGDLGDEQALSELVSGTTVIYHCAAMISGSWKDSYAVNVDGTRRLVLAAVAHGCRRFVHVSSVAVYSGAAPDAAYTEDTPLVENDEMAVYALTKLRSEKVLIDVAREHGIDYTILRPTCIYGPRTGSYTRVPVTMMQKRLPVMFGDGHGLMDVVYVEDIARAIVLASRSPRASGEVFNIGHQAVTLNEFYSCYGRMLNRPMKRVLPRVSAAVSGLLGRLVKDRDSRLDEFRRGINFLAASAVNSKKYSSSKASQMFGYTPQIKLPAGMLKTEIWAKRTGLIPPVRYALQGYGKLPFFPLSMMYPASEDEIVELVKTAASEKIKTRAIGSLHSFSPAPYTDGLCLVLDRYNRCLRVEGNLVTVQAGMKVYDLNRALARENLALPINGAITGYTVSGAISTATHGGSIHLGGLNDQVEAVRIIKADGSVVDIDRSHDLFDAAVVSMGLLGIISTVTFRCVPSFYLESASSVDTTREVLEDFDRINRENLHTDMLYFPVIDKIAVLRINKTVSTDVENGVYEEAEYSHPGRLAKFCHGLVALSMKNVALLLHHTGWNGMQKHLTGMFMSSVYQIGTGPSHRMLAFGDGQSTGRSPGLIQDMEVAIPYESAPEVIGILREYYLESGKYPLLPLHIRCSPRSRHWLSPAFEREICWIEFWQFPRDEKLFGRVHALLESYGYRVHWGKESPADHEHLARHYARWDDFVRLREEWDPEGMFLNEYLEPLFTSPQREDSAPS